MDWKWTFSPNKCIQERFFLHYLYKFCPNMPYSSVLNCQIKILSLECRWPPFFSSFYLGGDITRKFIWIENKTLNQRKTLANVFFTELIRSTDNFRLILLLHNVQIIIKKKKNIHADVLLSWLQNGTFNSYLFSTLLFVLLSIVLPSTFHIWGGDDPLAFKQFRWT